MFCASSAVASERDVAKEKAKAAIARADSAFANNRFREAAEAYLEAFEVLERHGLASRPALLYNAGLAFDELGECERAVPLYERFAAADPKNAPAELGARLAKARACAPEVVIQTVPSGAQVAIDGLDRGVAPIKINLRPGGHTLAVRLEGFRVLERAFAVEPKKPLALTLELVPSVRDGRIAIDAGAGVKIFIDGEAIAVGPYRGVRIVKAGLHVVRFEREACLLEEVSVDVPETETPVSVAEPACSPKPRAVELVAPVPPEEEAVELAWVPAGIAAAAVTTGVVFLTLHFAAANRRDRLLEDDEAMRDGAPIRAEDNAAYRHSIGAGISFGGAVIALGITGALIVFE